MFNKKEIKKLEKTIDSIITSHNNLKEEVYYIKNPPKFKIGDKVVFCWYTNEYVPTSTRPTQENYQENYCDYYNLNIPKKTTGKEIYTIISIRKDKYTGGGIPIYKTKYELIDENFKKVDKELDENNLSLCEDNRL